MKRSVWLGLAVLAAGAIVHAAAIAECPPPPQGVYDGVEIPEVLTRAEPDYPRIARDAGVQGTVLVGATVDCTGKVIRTRIIKSIPMLDQAAVEAAYRWTFKPGTVARVPVTTEVAIPVVFALHRAPDAAPSAPAPAPPPPRRNGIGSGDMPELGRYVVNGDPSNVVQITFERGDHVEMESPGQWTGSGVMHGREYWGIFQYFGDARDKLKRGARGTHEGTLDSQGRLQLTVTYRNRRWPATRVTWTLDDRDPFTRDVGQSPDARGIPIVKQGEGWQNPTWPPPGESRQPGAEHPVWPPDNPAHRGETLPARADSAHR